MQSPEKDDTLKTALNNPAKKEMYVEAKTWELCGNVGTTILLMLIILAIFLPFFKIKQGRKDRMKMKYLKRKTIRKNQQKFTSH